MPYRRQLGGNGPQGNPIERENPLIRRLGRSDPTDLAINHDLSNVGVREDAGQRGFQIGDRAVDVLEFVQAE